MKYLRAWFLWSIWVIFHHRETRQKAEEIIKNWDGFLFDPHTVETQARIYAIQLDLEDAKWHELIGEDR